MDISINEQNQDHIQRKIESGKYGSPDDVVGKAPELLSLTLGGGTYSQLDEPLSTHFGSLGQARRQLPSLPLFRLRANFSQSRRVIRLGSLLPVKASKKACPFRPFSSDIPMSYLRHRERE